MNHTKEPWMLEEKQYSTKILTEDGNNLLLTGIRIPMSAGDNQKLAAANARRIVACVNACKNFTTDELESVGEHFSGVLVDTKLRCAELVTERDAYRDLCLELVKQLKGVIAEAEFITQTDMAFGHGKLITKAEQLLGEKK